MGVEKVLSFFLTGFAWVAVQAAMLVFAVIACRRKKEKGLFILLCAIVIQLLALTAAGLAFSPFRIVGESFQPALRFVAWLGPGLASIVALVGWIVLARKEEKNS